MKKAVVIIIGLVVGASVITFLVISATVCSREMPARWEFARQDT